MSSESKSAKLTFGWIALLVTILPVGFFAAIQTLNWSGLPVYFALLGVYLAFYGLAHGIMNYPLIGQDTQLSFILLFAVLGAIEIRRRLKPNN